MCFKFAKPANICDSKYVEKVYQKQMGCLHPLFFIPVRQPAVTALSQTLFDHFSLDKDLHITAPFVIILFFH